MTGYVCKRCGKARDADDATEAPCLTCGVCAVCAPCADGHGSSEYCGECKGPRTFEVLLDGCSRPKAFTVPLSQFDMEELRGELRWRAKQYYDILGRLGASPSLLKGLRARMVEVETVLGMAA